jgi:hypothetical protein
VPEKPASATPAPTGFSWTKPVAAAEESGKTEADKNGDEAKKPAESPAVNLAAATGHECTALALLATCWVLTAVALSGT